MWWVTQELKSGYTSFNELIKAYRSAELRRLYFESASKPSITSTKIIKHTSISLKLGHNRP